MNVMPLAGQCTLPHEEEVAFLAQHEAMVASLLPVLGPVFGVAIVLFSVWDYLIDPGRAGQTMLLRLLLAGLGATAYFSTPLRWTPTQRCAVVYITHAGAAVAAAAMLEDGLLYGLAGVTACLFTVSVIAIRLRTFLAIVAVPSLVFLVLGAVQLDTFDFLNSAILYLFSLVLAAMLMLVIRVLRQRAFLSEKALLYSARHDSMTGACNKAHLTELAEREVALARRHGRALAVAMLDIDNFKRINDEHGHAVGDDVIRQLVETCRGSLRSFDHVGRIGGEEFVVVMPETQLQDAVACAERMRQNIAQNTSVRTPAGPVRFTASFGVAALCDAHQDWAALLHDADDAMYSAKRAGRNRVVTAPSGAGGRECRP